MPNIYMSISELITGHWNIRYLFIFQEFELRISPHVIFKLYFRTGYTLGLWEVGIGKVRLTERKV